MINVQEIRRNVINVVKNYSDAQVKVRKATSNESWGPSSTQMSEIADLTYNVVAFSEIMQIIWKRLNDHGKNWRHVFKALVLLEYLIKTGTDKVAQQCRDNLFAIQTLKDFQYIEENKDQGLSIREKSKALVALLKDEEKLKNERTKALKARERLTQSMSYATNNTSSSSHNSEGLDLGRSTSASFHDALPASVGDAAAAGTGPVNPELESARPQTVGEEELQLQLALAMSKEEAEQEERLRKNDDLRLKLALEESEKNKAAARAAAASASTSSSNVDDLLSLVLPSAGSVASTSLSNNHTVTDPWGSSLGSASGSASVGLGGGAAGGPSAFLPPPQHNHHLHHSHHKHQQQQASKPPTMNDDIWQTSLASAVAAVPSSSTASSASRSVFDSSSEVRNNNSFQSSQWPTSQPRTTSANNDPWALDNGGGNGGQSSTNAGLATSDPWNLVSSSSSTVNGGFKASEPLSIYPSLNGKILHGNEGLTRLFFFLPQTESQQLKQRTDAATRRTPESFLGANSNLVNLDALVSASSLVTSKQATMCKCLCSLVNSMS